MDAWSDRSMDSQMDGWMDGWQATSEHRQKPCDIYFIQSYEILRKL